MNDQKYDNQTINAYLLGSLPVEEAENLDELSFVDDEFADDLKAAEKDLIDAYVRGQLTGRELEQFESYYLASPLRREKVRFARAFQEFAGRQIPAAGPLPAADEATGKIRPAGLTSFWQRLTRPAWLVQWSLAAAALLFMILTVWLWTDNSRLAELANDTDARHDELARRETELQKKLEDERSASAEIEKELARVRAERESLEQELTSEKAAKDRPRAREEQSEQRRSPVAPQSPPARLSIASFVLAPPVRSSTQLPNLSIPQGTDLVAIGLELESDDFSSYRVALVDQSGQTLWRSGRVRTNSKGAAKMLNVRIPARLFKPQIYSLVLSGTDAAGATEIISNYSFRTVLE